VPVATVETCGGVIVGSVAPEILHDNAENLAGRFQNTEMVLPSEPVALRHISAVLSFELSEISSNNTFHPPGQVIGVTSADARTKTSNVSSATIPAGKLMTGLVVPVVPLVVFVASMSGA